MVNFKMKAYKLCDSQLTNKTINLLYKYDVFGFFFAILNTVTYTEYRTYLKSLTMFFFNLQFAFVLFCPL